MFCVRFEARPRSFLRLSLFCADVSGPVFPHFPPCFFDQLCDLSEAPVKIMNETRWNGGDLSAIASALKSKGYPVVAQDSGNSQVEFSCCAGSDGIWILSAEEDFSRKCGGSQQAKKMLRGNADAVETALE